MSRRTNNLLRLLASLLAVMLLSACVSREDEETFEETAENHLIKYINLSITVSTGNYATHRAPAGGENGDGREAGFERENVVNGITLILYNGSGLDDASAKVDYIAYFVTTLSSRQTHQTKLTGKTEEAVYTTGNQRLEDGAINTGDTYHAIVIANRNMTSQFPKGTPISAVRDYPFGASLYSGDAKKPNECNNFVMTSENDVTINFGGITPTIVGTSGLLYTVNTPILIERMAARIDFCTQNGNYDAYYGGYKYNVTGSGDMFVLTSVTPFNLYNEKEYLLKRVQDTWPATITTYLGDETTSNYVADPNTGNKDNTKTFSYLSPLASSMSTDYQQTMTSSTFKDSDGKQSIVVGYAKENTLMPTSHLKKYATGLAITGHYYKKESDGTYTDKGERTYYGYLRHQGESTSASAYPAKSFAALSDDETGTVTMNFGIVRNNIYRVSIESIAPETDETHPVTLKIKVKKWDLFTHAPIYM